MSKKNSHIDKETFLAQWLVGEITDETLESLVSEDDFKAYKKIQMSLDSFERPPLNIEKSYQKNILLKQKGKNNTTKVRKLIPNWAYTAVAVFVLAFGVLSFFNAKIKVNSSFGQSEIIHLNEGTVITLNAKSHVEYPKYKEQRTIYLEGEAFFEVNKKGDFSVSTPQGLVRVLGTKFNVISQGDFFEVICYEGKVKVVFKEKEYDLTPGNAWRSIEGAETKTWTSSETKPTWLQEESSFKSLPVKYVLKSLENQYDITIDTNSLNLNTLFTGSFRHDDLKSALHTVCLPLGYGFEILNKHSVILKKKGSIVE